MASGSKRLPVSAMGPALPGSSLLGATVGHCLLEKVIGQGGMGTVYQARHTTLNKLVAVKVLRTDLPADLHAVERFLHEARAAAQLDHPNIVSVYDAGSQDGAYYLVMQYVPGESLGDRLRREKSTTVPEALRIFRAMARGIHHAHAHGIVHRDIKPDNVLLGENGEVKIADFGLARLLEGDPSLSKTGTVIGSPNFMSPEQALGQHVDQRTDVYSLGATLYHMIAGTPPFHAETTMAVVYKVVREPLIPPHVLNPQVPKALSQYVCWLMRKDFRKRCASVEDCVAVLNRLGSSAAKAASSKRSRLSLVRLAAVSLSLVVLGFGLLLSPWSLSWMAVKSSSAQSREEGRAAAQAAADAAARAAAQAPAQAGSQAGSQAPAHAEAQAIPAADGPAATCGGKGEAPAEDVAPASSHEKGSSVRQPSKPTGNLIRRAFRRKLTAE